MSQSPLKLLSSMAPRGVLSELLAGYLPTSARTVVSEAAGGVDVAKRVRGGEQVDVVVLAHDAIDKLIDDGKLVGGRVDIVKSRIAVGVQAGKVKPDIGTEEAVRDLVLKARTLSYSTGPSGVYLEAMFERWGILEQIRDRIVVPPPGVPVGSLIADGSAELGFQQLSELLNVPDVEVIGPLPHAIQSITIFAGGVAAQSVDPQAARELLDYLASPAASSVKQRHGMEAA